MKENTSELFKTIFEKRVAIKHAMAQKPKQIHGAPRGLVAHYYNGHYYSSRELARLYKDALLGVYGERTDCDLTSDYMAYERNRLNQIGEEV